MPETTSIESAGSGRLEHDEQADERDAVDAVHERLAQRVAREDDERRAERDETESDDLERHERRESSRLLRLVDAPGGPRRRDHERRVEEEEQADGGDRLEPARGQCSRTSTAARTRNAGTLVAAAA